MLQLKNNLFDEISEMPREHYTFWFDYAAVASVEKKYIGFLIKRMLISIGLLFILSVYAAFSDSTLFAGMICVTFALALVHIKSILAYKKIFTKRSKEYPESLFDYTLFEHFLIIWISSPNGIKQRRVWLNEIEKVRIIGDIVVLEIDDQLYLMRRSELIYGSYFYYICQKTQRGKQNHQN